MEVRNVSGHASYEARRVGGMEISSGTSEGDIQTSLDKGRGNRIDPAASRSDPSNQDGTAGLTSLPKCTPRR